MKFYYLLLDILAIAFPLIRSFEQKIGFYKKWKYLFPGLLFANLIYIPWDIWFTKSAIWGFNEDYLTGLYFFSLPVEEWLFFLVIPYACFFLFEVGLLFFKLPSFRTAPVYHALLALALMVLGFRHMDQTYTCITFWGTAIALLAGNILLKTARWNYFWLMYGLSLIPFLIMNSALTGSFTPNPVVWYNPAENLGLRLFTIPIEDAVYLLFYLLLVFMIYEGKQPVKMPVTHIQDIKSIKIKRNHSFY